MNKKYLFLIFVIITTTTTSYVFRTKSYDDSDDKIDDVDKRIPIPINGYYDSKCEFARFYDTNFDYETDSKCNNRGFIFREYKGNGYCAKRCFSGSYALNDPLRCKLPEKCYRGDGFWPLHKSKCFENYKLGCEFYNGKYFPKCGFGMVADKTYCYPDYGKQCLEDFGYHLVNGYCVPRHYKFSIEMKLDTNPNNGICLPNFEPKIHNMDGKDQIICIDSQGYWRGVQGCEGNSLSYYLPDEGNRYNHLTCFLPCPLNTLPSINQDVTNPSNYPSCILTEIPMIPNLIAKYSICPSESIPELRNINDKNILVCINKNGGGVTGVKECTGIIDDPIGDSLDFYIPDNVLQKNNQKICFYPCPPGTIPNIAQNIQNPSAYPKCIKSILKIIKLPMKPDLEIKNTICSSDDWANKFIENHFGLNQVVCRNSGHNNRKRIQVYSCKNGSIRLFVPYTPEGTDTENKYIAACFKPCLKGTPNFEENNKDNPSEYPSCIYQVF